MIFPISSPNPIITMAMPRSGEAIFAVRGANGLPNKTANSNPETTAKPDATFSNAGKIQGRTKNEMAIATYADLRKNSFFIGAVLYHQTLGN